MTPVFEIDGLKVQVRRGGKLATPVDGVSLTVAAGECVGLVGESGCGKSMTLKAAMGLLPRDASLIAGEIRLAQPGTPPVPVDPETVRGRGVAMVFQEPMTALNPTRRVGKLIGEGVRLHTGARRAAVERRVLELMREVGIPDPERRIHAWPHELSGGLRQRVMIAMALSCEPAVLLCDEPTTALDVTVQDQILALLDRLRTQRGLAVVFVSHDLAVVGQMAHRIAVMYAGKIVEEATVDELLEHPCHPYTRGLLRSVPKIDGERQRLVAIGGSPPDPATFAEGCRFAPRCSHATAKCAEVDGALLSIGSNGHRTACIHHREIVRVKVSVPK